MKINIKDADLFNSDDDNDDSDDGEQADVKLWHLAICEWSFLKYSLLFQVFDYGNPVLGNMHGKISQAVMS